MEAGLQAGASPRPARRFGPGLVVAAAFAVLWLATPLWRAYLAKLSAEHAPAVLIGAAAGASAVWGLLWIGLLRRPAAVAGGLAVFAAVTLALSGNAVAGAIAAALLLATLCAGDLAARLLRGSDAGPGDLSSVFAAGLVAVSLVVLVLGETRLLSRAALAAALAAPILLRVRRLGVLARLVADRLRLPRSDAPVAIEACWLAFALLVLAALWVSALCPDVSWDGLAYHLPEARGVAVSGAVTAAPELAPQSLLWSGHETYLSLGFFSGGERVTALLQFAVGLFAFGATLALARRTGAGGSGPLALLLLAAFPTAMLQLHATYVDWPAAFLVTAAAAELAAARGDSGRVRLAAFLFGGAIVTKVFALAAAPALVVLAGRARPRARALAAALGCGLLALLPWLLWSARHAGSVAAPYASSTSELVSRLSRGHFFTTSPASGAAAAPVSARERFARFVRLPYDLVFHSSRFEANADGYNGVLVLVAAVGLAGWDRRRIGIFAAVALAALVPWSQLYLPSVRYLFPLFPLYAVFAAEGLTRLTGRFEGRTGAAAGLSLALAAAAFPVQFGSSGLEWRVAAGLLPRERYLDDRLPSHPLWTGVSPGDRVVLFGENDRFHCPAAAAWRDDYAPVAAWGRDPDAWRRGLKELQITAVLARLDRRPATALLEALSGVLEPVARRGPAVLYRVRS